MNFDMTIAIESEQLPSGIPVSDLVLGFKVLDLNLIGTLGNLIVKPLVSWLTTLVNTYTRLTRVV